MFPADRHPVPVTVVYDGGQRRFADAYTARRFYAVMDKQGRTPHVRSDAMTPEVTTAADVVEKKAPKAKKAAPKAKPAAKKAPKAKPATDNLSREDAVAKVLKALAKSRHSRTELKEVAPYGNYTALMRGIEEEGLVKAVKHEDDSAVFYEITAKGRKQNSK